jgi:dihydropteroate synthase
MILQHRAGTLDLSQPVVMGVLNVTPDSFSDGGQFLDPERAVAHALQLRAEGAAIIDVGGESSKPGAQPVSVEEELRRVLPVVQRLTRESGMLVSVDTSRAEVIRAVSDAGAVMINDVRALLLPGALSAAAASGVAVCLMHMQGEPSSMQQHPNYDNVVTEVRSMLQARVAACETHGIEATRLCIDPGFGFGKTIAHNLELLRRLGEFGSMRLPVLVGLSRKSMLKQLTGRSVEQRLAGSLALATIAVMHGARIVRAHDVEATVDALRVCSALLAQGNQESVT